MTACDVNMSSEDSQSWAQMYPLDYMQFCLHELHKMDDYKGKKNQI